MTFKDESDTDQDPTTVTGKFKDPAGNVTTYVDGTDTELVKDSIGNYHYDITLDEAGKWRYRGDGVGVVVAAGEGRFNVRESAF